MFHDTAALPAACGTFKPLSAVATRQADLVSRILHARRQSDAVSERILTGELLASVRPVIRRVVRCFMSRAGTLSPDDLAQVATIAVIRTVDKYDTSRGGQSFGEVAYFRVRAACEQHARMHASDVHVSDGAHKGRTVRGSSGVRIIVHNADELSRDEDATQSRSRSAGVLEAALRAFSGQEGDGESPEERLLEAERRALVLDAVRRLAPQSRELVCRVYGINQAAQSVRSVAETWGAPKSRVDRMLARALVELRGMIHDLGE
ncbi:sigma-70 family RNA polymerase sigma factor [Corallococcus sp. H22C18031201]|nr:sigma-70 family RNA polymerase sigma factor [Corallococcus sp. H22C18031201]